jgi:hypothetical protein
MNLKLPLPISQKYDSPIFEAVALQFCVALFICSSVDGEIVAQICGVALVAFWGGAATLICRHAHAPSQSDLQLIRFGYFPILLIAFLLVPWIWHLRGVL